jgi:hypothetical protein
MEHTVTEDQIYVYTDTVTEHHIYIRGPVWHVLAQGRTARDSHLCQQPPPVKPPRRRPQHQQRLAGRGNPPRLTVIMLPLFPSAATLVHWQSLAPVPGHRHLLRCTPRRRRRRHRPSPSTATTVANPRLSETLALALAEATPCIDERWALKPEDSKSSKSAASPARAVSEAFGGVSEGAGAKNGRVAPHDGSGGAALACEGDRKA